MPGIPLIISGLGGCPGITSLTRSCFGELQVDLVTRLERIFEMSVPDSDPSAKKSCSSAVTGNDAEMLLRDGGGSNRSNMTSSTLLAGCNFEMTTSWLDDCCQCFK